MTELEQFRSLLRSIDPAELTRADALELVEVLRSAFAASKPF